MEKISNSEIIDALNNYNTITPDTRMKLQNITKLELNDSEITNLPESIGNLTNLIGINLENNQLTCLPEPLIPANGFS